MLPSMPVLVARDSQDGFGNHLAIATTSYNNGIATKSSKTTEVIIKQHAQKLPNVEPTPKVQNAKQKDQSKDETTEYNTYEQALVVSFFNKVQGRFGSIATRKKFVQFQDILKTFDSTKETPIDLYRKLELLFGDDNSDLMEEFLLFLTPGQATEVGRFMDHFIINKMAKFIDLLKTTFSDEPAMVRKIMRFITKAMNSENLNEMRSKVLPHLRSSQRLTLLFKSLFLDNVPPDSLYESNTDILDEAFLTEDQGCDVWEFEEPTENRRNFSVKEGLDTKYLQGRVFLQYGKNLKVSNVTYPYSKEPYRVHARRLAPAHCPISPPHSDEEISSPSKATNKTTPKAINKRAKKTNCKSPSRRNVTKDVNDNNKTNHMAEFNSKVASSTDSPKMKLKSQHVSHSNKKINDNKIVETKNTKHSKEGNKTDNKKNNKVKEKSDRPNPDKKDEPVKPKRAKLEDVRADNSWKRDEDKTMLEMLQGHTGSEELFCRIKQVLPHRSIIEIKERFFHVMELLQQMAVGNVT